MEKLNTVKVVNANSEPMVVEKEGKFIAVSIEMMQDTYVVAFDVIPSEKVNNFNLEKDEYETIGIIECQNQNGGFLDSRNYCLELLDKSSLDEFKKVHFE